MEKVCGMTWIGELFFRFQKEPADELSSQHNSKSRLPGVMALKPSPMAFVYFPLDLPIFVIYNKPTVGLL